MATAQKKEDTPITIKKYANRRLYDTGRSSYVTLDDLCTMVKDGQDFIVIDAKSGNDLTRQVLTQIIVDQESKGENMLPTNFLRKLIGFYGDNIQSMIPDYLEHSIDNFSKNQEKLKEQINQSLGGVFPANTLEEMSKKNMAMFEDAMKSFSSFPQMKMPSMNSAKEKNDGIKNKIDTLKANIAEMEKEIKNLSK